MNILGLIFEKTCCGSPEEYDVYIGSKYLAYVRLRWGCLSVCEECVGKEIYFFKYKDEYKGMFDNEKQRLSRLSIVARKIIKHYKKG